MPVNAGTLDRSVTLSHRMLQRNDQGEEIATWKTYATVWAQKRDMHGAKRFAAKEFYAEEVVEFTVRWRSDMLLTDRITLIENGALYEVTQISEIGRHEGLDLLTRTIVA